MARAREIVKRLRSLASPSNVQGMARFGINPEGTLGVSIPTLRRMAKEIGRDHGLALELWETGVHEARILAALVGDPARVTGEQMDAWVREFDSWDVCDQVCMNLFDRTGRAYAKALEWAARAREFERRAGFALMACLAWHRKDAPDSSFERFLPAIERGSDDGRNFVKKAVSWALRVIGKRNARLNGLAVAAAGRIGERGSKAANWVSRDVLRELTSEKVRARLGKAAGKKRGAARKVGSDKGPDGAARSGPRRCPDDAARSGPRRRPDDAARSGGRRGPDAAAPPKRSRKARPGRSGLRRAEVASATQAGPTKVRTARPGRSVPEPDSLQATNRLRHTRRQRL